MTTKQLRTVISSILVYGCVICFPILVQAQDTLQFIDLSDRSPIEGVQVKIIDAEGIAVSDTEEYSNMEGQVYLDNFKSGQYILINNINYHPIRMNWFQVKALNGKILLESRAKELIEVVVYGNSKKPESVKEVPSQITLIDKEDIKLYNPQTSADALAKSGDVFVQKSQMGGGSPVLRGFEANKVLLVIDGIRMNNAIYRSGHLQNVITIDNAMLDRIEVYHGPASVIYGSDALGGVMYFTTKKPKLRKLDIQKPVELNAYTRFSTANFERTAHVDFNMGSKKFASLTSVTYSSFDDLRAGRIKLDSNMAQYWNRYFYVEREDSMDMVRINENPNVQVGTGYSQLDILQKLRFQPSDQVDIVFNFQASTSSDVPRYDQLTEGETNFINGQIISQDLEYAEWSYGPQNRMLASIHTTVTPDSFHLFDRANFVAAFQKLDEDRITRKYNDLLRRVQAENVYVFTVNGDFNKKMAKQMFLQYGVEGTHNIVYSDAETFNILSLESSRRGLGTRYPDGGSSMSTGSAYASYRWKINNRANLIAGARYTFTDIKAAYVDSSLYDLPYNDINIQTNALTGSFGIAWDMGHQFQFNGIVSNAFRTPNIDDIAKIRAKGGTVSIPNPNVQPEKAINTEITIIKQFTQKVKIEGTFFHNYLYDALVQDFNFSINGADTMYYDGRFRKINALVNVGRARIWGFHSKLAVEFNEHAFLKGAVTYTRGRDITETFARPLAHIPPVFGQLSFLYKRQLFNLNLMVQANGPKPLAEYADASSDNLDQALPSGTPAWFTINIYTSFRLTKAFTIDISMENLLDWHYRPFSSGVSAPGQNVILTLRGSF